MTFEEGKNANELITKRFFCKKAITFSLQKHVNFNTCSPLVDPPRWVQLKKSGLRSGQQHHCGHLPTISRILRTMSSSGPHALMRETAPNVCWTGVVWRTKLHWTTHAKASFISKKPAVSSTPPDIPWWWYRIKARYKQKIRIHTVWWPAEHILISTNVLTAKFSCSCKITTHKRNVSKLTGSQSCRSTVPCGQSQVNAQVFACWNEGTQSHSNKTVAYSFPNLFAQSLPTLWMPQWYTIDELIVRATGEKLIATIAMICTQTISLCLINRGKISCGTTLYAMNKFCRVVHIAVVIHFPFRIKKASFQGCAKGHWTSPPLEENAW